MAKEQKRGRGRPKADNPKKVQLNLRIDDETRDALEAYRKRQDLGDVSEAARHAMRRTLRGEGLIEE